jgi:hypothetical protein
VVLGTPVHVDVVFPSPTFETGVQTRGHSDNAERRDAISSPQPNLHPRTTPAPPPAPAVTRVFRSVQKVVDTRRLRGGALQLIFCGQVLKGDTAMSTVFRGQDLESTSAHTLHLVVNSQQSPSSSPSHVRAASASAAASASPQPPPPAVTMPSMTAVQRAQPPPDPSSAPAARAGSFSFLPPPAGRCVSPHGLRGRERGLNCILHRAVGASVC